MRADVIPVRGVEAAFVDAWAQLAASSLEPNPFHQSQCVVPADRLLAEGTDVGLLVVWEADRLVFLLPVHRMRHYRRLPVATASWWRHPYAYVSTPLVAEGVDVASVWTAALRHLAQDGRSRVLALELFPLDGPVYDGLDQAARTFHGTTLFDSFDRAVLRRRPEPTYLEDRVSSRHQKNLRRYARRLVDELGGEVAVVDRASQCDAAFDRAVEGFLAQEAAGWKGRDGGAFACRPDHADFFRQFAADFRRSGQLELWTLGTDEVAVAYQCNIRHGDTIFHWKVAYDETFSRWSPGLQLEVAMVDAFHRDLRVNRIDSCTDAGTKVSEQLYPDRRPIGFLLVPLGGGPARMLTTSAPQLARAYRGIRSRALAVRDTIDSRVR